MNSGKHLVEKKKKGKKSKGHILFSATVLTKLFPT